MVLTVNGKLLYIDVPLCAQPFGCLPVISIQYYKKATSHIQQHYFFDVVNPSRGNLTLRITFSKSKGTLK